MVEFKGEKFGRLKVVQGAELDSLTMSGWRLVFVAQETVLGRCMEQEPTVHGSTVCVERFKPIVVTNYVMGLDEASAIAKLDDELVTARWERDQAKNNAITLTRDRDAEKGLAAALEKRAADLEVRLSATQKRLDEAWGQARSMEADLAKVREAVGAIRMKEILGR